MSNQFSALNKKTRVPTIFLTHLTPTAMTVLAEARMECPYKTELNNIFIKHNNVYKPADWTPSDMAHKFWEIRLISAFVLGNPMYLVNDGNDNIMRVVAAFDKELRC